MDIIFFFETHPQLFILLVGFVSLFIGSFLNVVIYRLPRMMQQSWTYECKEFLNLPTEKTRSPYNLFLPLSHCPKCNKTILPWHNIPVISYLFLQGKCANCKTQISLRYPFVELLTGLSSLFIAWWFGFNWQTLAALLFVWTNICLIFIDIDFKILPDELTLSLLWLGLFLSLFNVFCPSHDAILGAISGYLIFAIIQFFFGLATNKVGIGQGDYKFLAALGGFFGWQSLLGIIMLASISGLLVTLLTMLYKNNFKSEPLPFGPYLAFAGIITLLYGQEFLEYYLTFFS